MSGTFSVDFTNKTIKGNISKSDLNIAVSSKINPDATFKGDAVANKKFKGTSEGRFLWCESRRLSRYGYICFKTWNTTQPLAVLKN